MPTTLRFDFREYPGTFDQAIAAASTLILQSHTIPLAVRVEVVCNGTGEAFADRLAELFGKATINQVRE